jgi:hypothetical protein
MSDFDKLRSAYVDANNGELDGLVGMFATDTVWHGVERGHLWWRNAPS